MADVIKKLGHTAEEMDGHLDSTELHIQEGERDKWNKAADTANTASTTATAAQSEAAINRTTLGFRRKNWLKNTATSQTVNGITFTINDDKSITANGTATAFTSLNIGTNVPITDGDFIYTCTPQGGSEATYRAIIRAYDSNNSAVTETLTETGEGIKITISNGSYINAIIRISSGTTVDNLTFYPMLRYAEITDDTYEPYRDSVDERLTAVENSVEIAKPTLTVNATYIANSRLYCHKVGKLVFIQGTITTSAEVPAWTTGLISGLPTISQAYYFRIIRTGTTASTPTIYLNSGGTTVNVENNALAAEATYYLNFCYIEY